MKRRLFTLLSTLSLLLCVGVGVSWVLCLDQPMHLMRKRIDRERSELIMTQLFAEDGRIQLRYRHRSSLWSLGDPEKPNFDDWSFSRATNSTDDWNYSLHYERTDTFAHYSFLGLGYGSFQSPDWSFFGVAVPFSFIGVAFALPPSAWVWHWRKRRRALWRRKSGLCLRCGYDLRVSPERCPECGAVAELKT